MIYSRHIKSLLEPFIIGDFEVTIYKDIDDFYFTPVKGDKERFHKTRNHIPVDNVKVLCERAYEWQYPNMQAVYWVDEGETVTLNDNPNIIFPPFSILIEIPHEDYRTLHRNTIIGEGFIAGMIYAQYKAIDAIQKAELAKRESGR